MSQTRSRIMFSAAVVLSCWLAPGAWTQEANVPAVMNTYFYCYGPKAQGRLAPPDKTYFSDVSPAVYPRDQLPAGDAFRDYVAKQYGATFEPQCDWHSTEEAARRILEINASRLRGVVRTGWTWAAPTTSAPSRPVAPSSRH